MSELSLGTMRCTRSGCGGTLGASGQEVTRLICIKCGQNYQLCVFLNPIEPKKSELALPPPVESAE